MGQRDPAGAEHGGDPARRAATRARAATPAAPSSASAVASGAPALGGVDALRWRSAIRTARRSRRRSRTVAPPSGEASSASAAGSSSPTGGAVRLAARAGRRQQRRERAEQRRDGRLTGQRQVVGGHRDRDAGRGQRAAQRTERAGGADDDRHLRPRHAVEQVGAAQHVGEVGRLDRRGGEDVHLGGPRVGAVDRAPAGGAPTGPGSPSATLRLIRSSSSPDRRQTPSETRPGRPAVGVPEAVGELDDAPRLGPAEGVDRLVGIADGDEVAAAAGQQLEQLDLGGVGVLVLVDEQPAGALALLAQQLGVAVELGDRLRGPARRGRSRTRRRGRRWRRR